MYRRASPVQLVVMAISQSFFYAFNKVVIVLGLWGAEDVGGSMTIHMFGAYFGLAVSYVLGPPKPDTAKNAEPNATSDLTALIGTTLLWVYCTWYRISNGRHCVVYLEVP